MRSFALFMTALAIAASVSAQIIPLPTAADDLVSYEASLKAPAPTAVARRNEKDDDGFSSSPSCISKVLSIMSPPYPANQDFRHWLSTLRKAESCAVTVPASFSSAYLSYYPIYRDYYNGLPSELAAITGCGRASTSLDSSLYPSCTGSQTVVFTEISEEPTTTVLPGLDQPTSLVVGGSSSSWNRGIIPTVISLAGVIAAILAA